MIAKEKYEKEKREFLRREMESGEKGGERECEMDEAKSGGVEGEEGEEGAREREEQEFDPTKICC